MNIGKVVSVVESEPVIVDDELLVNIVYRLDIPLEYITVEINEAPVLEPVPA